jgi:hypothetical protein
MATSKKADSVVGISDAEIASIIEGHPETKLETNTVVEDRTEAPEIDRPVEYEIEHQEGYGPNGDTILTNYGEPVGGRSSEPEAAE